MHTTAHPDDEHGGALTMLSRRDGARVSLLTLTRGESGDNAIGPQLFDALALIRTEELLVADRYYGVDAQYFTTAADYGFSKRLDEALEKWGKEAVLSEMVRIIRMDRPLVLVSRFQGNERDGHGNHSAAGLLTRDAYIAAGEPNMFPDQIAEGLRPWKPLKLYIGGARENEPWAVKIDANEYSPWLGETYGNFARLGLSFQRSQNGGRYVPQYGAAPAFYARADSTAGSAKEATFFDGIDTSLAGLFATLRQPSPPGADAALTAVDRAVTDARNAFTMTAPWKAVPSLARGLRATRAALGVVASSPDAVFTLRIKEQQFQDAINAALGIDLRAVATLGAPPVPGQTFEVVAEFVNHSPMTVERQTLSIDAAKGWTVVGNGTARFTVTLADDVGLSTREPFRRTSIAENRYTVADAGDFARPSSRAPASVVATYVVDGERVSAKEVVRWREPRLPYGDALREVRVVPALALAVEPPAAIAAAGSSAATISIDVDIRNNDVKGSNGRVSLRLPAGWKSEPASHEFAFTRAGERRAFDFTVSVPPGAEREYSIQAVAAANGRTFEEGYELIEQRDLEPRYLYRRAAAIVRSVPVTIPKPLVVGYVMGIGDRVPEGIAQLGHAVVALSDHDLATGNLQRFEAIVTGTRAYSVRAELNTSAGRLLEYVRQGGNLIVLYNTAEMVPSRVAPFAGELTTRAEEVSEEDSPVTILAPTDRVFSWPNIITKADFDGWIEQRGSKFWSSWAADYTPMIETWDKGQAPQRGGWLHARYGKGHYTYFAYALHRQLPYAVPGAYRILENLLALGTQP